MGALYDGEDKSKVHLVWIRNLTKLLGNSRKHRQIFCERCLTPHSPATITRHEEQCWSHAPTRIIMPEPGGRDHMIEFRQWRYRLPAPFVIYADFECLLMNPQGLDREEQEQQLHKGTIMHLHQPCGFAYSIQCQYPEHRALQSPLGKPLQEIRTYIGHDAVKQFLQTLLVDVDFLYAFVNETELPYEEEEGDQTRFEAATHCHICLQPLTSAADKVLDHDHFTGKYRGAAHRDCNSHFTSYKKHYMVPVVFHNLRGYDSYIIIRGVKEVCVPFFQDV